MDAHSPDQKLFAEIVAQLDVFERDLLSMVKRLREYRHVLSQGLDTDLDGLVD